MSKNSKIPNHFLPQSTDLYGFHRLRTYSIRSLHSSSLNFTQSGSYLDSKKLKHLNRHISKHHSYKRVSINIDDASNTPSSNFVEILESLSRHPVTELVIKDISSFKNHSKLNTRLSVIVSKLKMLKKIEFILPSEIKNEALFNLYISFSTLRLKSLEVHFAIGAYHVPPSIGIHTLSKLLSKLTTLNSLACEFKIPQSSLGDHAKALKHMSSKLQGIKNLNLTLDEDMELASFLPVNKKLESLEIKSAENTLSGLGFLNLSESLEALKKLVSLSVCLDGIDKATQPTAENFAISLAQLRSLKHISLKVSRPSNANNIKIQRLFEFLPELEGLEEIEIDLSKVVSAKLALKDIGKGISLQKNLRSVKLDFEDCGLTDLELSSIAEGFSTNFSLKQFHLNIKDNKQIICAGIVEIFRNLKEQTLLENFYMNLSGITHLSDQSLKGYLEILLNNQNLKSISLFLSGCRSLSDEWVIKFAEAVKTSWELRSLVLGLNDCQLVSDRSFIRMVRLLGGFKYLENIAFGVERCQVTNKSVPYLKEMIKELKGLKFLQLRLPGDKKISHEAFIELGSALKYSKSLNRIAMDQYPFTPLKEEPMMVIEDCRHSSLGGFN